MPKALNRAAQKNSQYSNILNALIGAIFLGTPFLGTRAVREVNWLLIVGGIMGDKVSKSLVKDLDARTGGVKKLVQEFAEIANASWLRLPIRCFYETQRTEVLRCVIGRSWATRFSIGLTNKIVSSNFQFCGYESLIFLS